MDKVEVTQEDREAAAQFSESIVGKTNGRDEIARCREGKEDATYLVQAFARHRAAAEAAAEQRGFKLCQDAAVKRLEGKAERARIAAIGNGMDPSDATLLDYEFSLAADELRTLTIKETGNAG
ncbi:hypothetical protein [Sphingomonas sp.]|uniref:hypothetical protein n=1 Tax=Sphingomonas sp. TaxID=28214 RepID=UPI003F72DDFE